MIISRISPRTGEVNEREIPITAWQYSQWRSGALIQSVFSDLSPDDREFLMTGYTPEDWACIFPEEEQDGIIWIS